VDEALREVEKALREQDGDERDSCGRSGELAHVLADLIERARGQVL
jgi:hypothetical protein